MSATAAALIELERLAVYTQSRQGLVPEWAPRPRMPWEIAAHTNFAAIDRIMVKGYTLSAAHLAEFKAALIHDLSTAVGGETERRAIQWKVSDWVAGRSGKWTEAAAQAVDQVNATLVQTAAAAGRQLMTEAAAQGVKVPLQQALVGEGVLAASAELPVTATKNIIRQAATLAAQRPGGKDAITAAVDKASIKPAEDLARQGVNIAHGEGRAAVADDLPPPSEIYASELLDRATCLACKAIDGTQYETLAAAYADYPNAGTYIGCAGGGRCRGTLVLVYGEGDQSPPPTPEPPPPPPPKPTPMPAEYDPWNPPPGVHPQPPGVPPKNHTWDPVRGEWTWDPTRPPKPSPGAEWDPIAGEWWVKPPPVPAPPKPPGVGPDGTWDPVTQEWTWPEPAVPHLPMPQPIAPISGMVWNGQKWSWPAKPPPVARPVPVAKPVGEPITKEIRTFANREEGQGWAHDIWPGPEAYTDPQRAAIRDYTGSGYRSVNRALRESAGKKGKLQALDNAMTRAPRVPEPVQVARGLDTTWAYAMNGGSLNLTEMVGREYTEHGYMSTSVSNRGALGGSVSILMDVPAGSKALYVSGKVGDSASTTLSAQGSYEAEMLFPRGSRYRIDSAVPSGTGNWVLHATLLP